MRNCSASHQYAPCGFLQQPAACGSVVFRERLVLFLLEHDLREKVRLSLNL